MTAMQFHDRFDDRQSEAAGFGLSALARVDAIEAVEESLAFMQLEEIADAIAFLVSPIAGYITGVNLRIDGGLSPSLQAATRLDGLQAPRNRR